MEKLIELLNEYEVEKEKSEGQETDVFVLREWTYTDYSGIVSYDRTDQWEGDHYYSLVAVPYIISKSYGFIKWLLNNQKIDQEKLDHSLDSCSYIKNDLAGSCIKLTMFLSIQDKPIEFLVSILK